MSEYEDSSDQEEMTTGDIEGYDLHIPSKKEHLRPIMTDRQKREADAIYQGEMNVNSADPAKFDADGFLLGKKKRKERPAGYVPRDTKKESEWAESILAQIEDKVKKEKQREAAKQI